MTRPTKKQKPTQGKQPIVEADVMRMIEAMMNKVERPPLNTAVTTTTEEVTTMQQNAQPEPFEATPPTNAAKAEKEVSQIDELRKAKRVKIVIDEQDNHEGHKDVSLSIDGYVLVIQRGKTVEVPEPFVELLNNLKYTIISKNDNGEDVSREVPRFHWRKVA